MKLWDRIKLKLAFLNRFQKKLNFHEQTSFQDLLSKHQKLDEARKTLIKFKVLVEVSPLDDKIVELALVSDFRDFEDAIQYCCAIENNLTTIITRNTKDFKKSTIKVVAPEVFIAKFR